MRYEPLRAIRREFDRLFEDLLPAFQEDGVAPMWTPRLDLTERDDAFVARMDLPGLKPEDVQVEVEDDRLTVRGERKQETTETREDAVRMERTYGSFFRAFTLPKTVLTDAVEATFHDGVLTLTLPKSPETQPRRIEVRPEAKELSMN
jgi:HSP20 family protein